MRRHLAALAVTPLAMMAFAGPAAAQSHAGSPVTHLNERSRSAEAQWTSESGGLVTESGVMVYRTSAGTELHLWRATYGPDGPSGVVVTSADADSGFTFTISRQLTTATVTATDLPVLTCTLDEYGEPIGECTTSTVDVTLTWTGEGKITRGSYTEHQKGDGYSLNVHATWTSRAASVAGSVTGFDLSAANLSYASLSQNKQVKTGRCFGDACQYMVK